MKTTDSLIEYCLEYIFIKPILISMKIQFKIFYFKHQTNSKLFLLCIKSTAIFKRKKLKLKSDWHLVEWLLKLRVILVIRTCTMWVQFGFRKRIDRNKHFSDISILFSAGMYWVIWVFIEIGWVGRRDGQNGNRESNCPLKGLKMKGFLNCHFWFDDWFPQQYFGKLSKVFLSNSSSNSR